MLKPRALRPGDRIAVVAPASPFDRAELDGGLAEIEHLGFVPVFDDSLFARRSFVAGDAELRAAALRSAWRDPSIAAIIGVRGGYGSVQLLPRLSVEEIRATPKAFVGYSDLTSILTFLTVGCGLVGFHGPMLERRLSRGEAGYDRPSFLDCLTRAEPPGEMAPPGLDIVRAGSASGVLFGGTLAQLAASLGTPYAFRPPAGSVLFLEEVAERPYRLDRMLTQLRLAGVFEGATAIVVGELPGCDEAGGGPTARDVIADVFQTFRGPVLYGFPSGHTAGPLVTLPLGVRVRVVAEGPPRLVIEEAAVT